MKLLLAAVATTAALTLAPAALAQDADDDVAAVDQAPAPSGARVDLHRRADWLEARIHQDVGLNALRRADADDALDDLRGIRDDQDRLDDDGLTVADAQVLESRLNALEDHVRAVDARSGYWPPALG